jgi:hypothetical protein
MLSVINIAQTPLKNWVQIRDAHQLAEEAQLVSAVEFLKKISLIPNLSKLKGDCNEKKNRYIYCASASVQTFLTLTH